MQRYEELRIRIRRTAPGRYLALASGSACAVGMLVCEEGESARLRTELDRLIGVELGNLPRGRTRVERAVPELGRRLYELLFPEPLSQCFKEALEQAQNRGMRLRLRFDLPPELQELPIEVLTSPPERWAAGWRSIRISRSYGLLVQESAPLAPRIRRTSRTRCVW
ncbi:hypothetical protein ACFQ0G_40550 [Streptomyces chiangmaiensis]